VRSPASAAAIRTARAEGAPAAARKEPLNASARTANVIALTAIVLNMLSVVAAYGLLVIVFQHGFGESLLGFQSTGAIVSWLPLFLVVVLFGLSMDYHVDHLTSPKVVAPSGRVDRVSSQVQTCSTRPRRQAMWSRAALGSVAAIVGIGASIAGVAAGRGLNDIPKGFAKFAPLKSGLYQASLFEPPARFSIPDANWNGAQWVKNGYHVVVLSWRAHNGGWEMHSAPAAKESAPSALHRLETERAAGSNVGMKIRPAVAVTIGGFRGWQFDGTVIGRFGHTFVPFLGTNGSKADNGDRLAHDTAFRIIVLSVRGKVIFSEIDSDAPKQDPVLLSEATKIIHSLAFPS
jgi:hypothetical protein